MQKKILLSLLLLQTAFSAVGASDDHTAQPKQSSPWRDLLVLTMKEQQEVSLIDSLRIAAQATTEFRDNTLQATKKFGDDTFTAAKSAANSLLAEGKDMFADLCSLPGQFRTSLDHAEQLKLQQNEHTTGKQMSAFFWWLHATAPSLAAAVKSRMVPVAAATLAGIAAAQASRVVVKAGLGKRSNRLLYLSIFVSAVYGAVFADRSKADVALQLHVGRRMMVVALLSALAVMRAPVERQSVKYDAVTGIASALAFRTAYYLQSKQSARA